MPPPGHATLEVGCGEGRVARDLAARGHRVTAIDISRTLIGLAAEADGASTYLLADGVALPFAEAAFDLVVAYNSHGLISQNLNGRRTLLAPIDFREAGAKPAWPVPRWADRK